MQQWFDCKETAQEALLLFQMGDFYEAFYEDAVTVAKELDLTLTKRQEIPMCGVPLHTCDSYIDRLLAKGYRVAVADQTEDPKQVKGLVKREVVKVVTPGTVVSSSLLDEKANNFLAGITQVGSLFGLSYVDLTTGEFMACEFEGARDLFDELYRLSPSEILTHSRFEKKQGSLIQDFKLSSSFLLTVQEDWKFEHQLAFQSLASHFEVGTLDGFGLKGATAGVNAAGAMINYLKETLLNDLEQVQDLGVYSTSKSMSLDSMTQKHLELTEALHHQQGKKNTLLHLLDETRTGMGGRKLRNWLQHPLLAVPEIQFRQESVEELFLQRETASSLAKELEEMFDIERLAIKIGTNSASPQDFTALSHSLKKLPSLQILLKKCSSPLLGKIRENLQTFDQVTHLIDRALVEEPPARASDGNLFRDGYSDELDQLREIRKDSKAWISCYQSQLREETGIKTLKVSYNRMFGYYIEVSKGQVSKMPSNFQRRQTLVNAERYISPELKTYENKVLNAEEKIGAIEAALFKGLKEEVGKYAREIKEAAKQVALLDALLSLAAVAGKYGYVKPEVHEGLEIDIVEGRHPVIERSPLDGQFVPNDMHLDSESQRMLILTGPNMAGKSTYIRQAALICILAQIGSFVPAKKARIGVVDKIFTRIGASDDLSRGQSTFMVEMTETANILNNATDRSLVVLDEIGRGTSTYDGISIAWAVAEYLLTAEGKRAKTLFATHYWELTRLEESLFGAVNYHVAVQEYEDTVLFLHKIVKGGTDRSYGIHVACLAGMPSWVISRSKEILAHLEENGNRKSAFEPDKPRRLPPKNSRRRDSEYQLMLFGKS